MKENHTSQKKKNDHTSVKKEHQAIEHLTESFTL